MTVRFHPHALERMAERGASKLEVEAVIAEGEKFSAKFARQGFRQSFTFAAEWKGNWYANKQIDVFAVWENQGWLVITVITRYF